MTYHGYLFRCFLLFWILACENFPAVAQGELTAEVTTEIDPKYEASSLAFFSLWPLRFQRLPTATPTIVSAPVTSRWNFAPSVLLACPDPTLLRFCTSTPNHDGRER